MARPKGSKNQKAGKTFFFDLCEDNQASQAIKHQVVIHHTTTGHWEVTHYLNGDKQNNAERVVYETALGLSGLSKSEFDMLFERTTSATWAANMQRKATEVYNKYHQ